MTEAPPAIRGHAPRLPRELKFVYLFAPLVAAPVLSSSFFEGRPEQMLREAAANYIAFLTIGGALHATYVLVVPRLLPQRATRTVRGVVHVGVIALVALLGGTLVYPLVTRLLDHGPTLGLWQLRCVALALALILPALAIASLRDRAEQTERRLDAQREAALRVQLEAIQARTNPHFLFNAMNTIASLVREDPALAERTVERLAEVLRYALQSSRRERVTLREELAVLRDYLEIQRARFGERLRYSVDLEPSLERISVPPLLLQPLVENAVVHAVTPRAAGATIRVTGQRSGDAVLLRVADDGPGPGRSTQRGTGTSLADLARRLELLFGAAGFLVTCENEDGGFSAEIRLPLLGGGP